MIMESIVEFEMSREALNFLGNTGVHDGVPDEPVVDTEERVVETSQHNIFSRVRAGESDRSGRYV